MFCEQLNIDVCFAGTSEIENDEGERFR